VADQITVTKTVDASPQQLFALLSTPARHTDIDGAAMLRGLDGPGEVSGVGDQFVMKMHNDALGDYQMKNTITTYEPDAAIGWAPQIHPLDGYTDKLGDVQAKGHTYTWHLEPAGSDQTKVTQVYDWSAVQDEGFRGFFPMLTEQQLTDSIDKAAAAAK
jgi:hypothetical protein